MSVRTAYRAGISLIELVVVVAVIGVLAAIAVPSISDMRDQARIRGFARDVGNMFQMARSQAMRTGNHYLVFFGPAGTTDPAGNVINDAEGNSVAMLILDDGSAATANCHIDGGEDIDTLALEIDVGWGVTNANVRSPNDSGTAAFSPPQSSGSTFSDPSNNATNWVLFRSDGVPVGVAPTSTTCGTIGSTGTGGASIYLTNGTRDYAVVLSPLGDAGIHIWNGTSWTQ
jgi:prepilin-type N-terminal cleavage/methylation domain-containing protein